MSEKRKRDGSWYDVIQRGLLLLHLTVYISLWTAAFMTLLQLPAFATDMTGALPLHSSTQRLILVALIWSLVFMAHVASFAYSRGRSSSALAERQAYRDGVHDAVSQIPISTHRLEDLPRDKYNWDEEEPDPQEKSSFR